MKRRATKQRAAILKALRNNRTHPTADQIYDVVRRQIRDISKGTVYRNLQVLREDGAILELNLNGTLNRYEEKQSRHYHFRCEKCGRVFDLDEPVNTEIDKRVSARTGLKVSFHYTEFWGLCKDCQQKQN
ncbi:MAG: transcriptional repressor [candidate division Zixibacteria bacterium]|nr:transcriptional repressor [candidate division Zixibacteria bacterium]